MSIRLNKKMMVRAYRSVRMVLLSIVVLSAVGWPFLTQAANTACQCVDRTANKRLMCYCGAQACTKACPANHACSCDDKQNQGCVKANPCASEGLEVAAEAPTIAITLLPEMTLTNAFYVPGNEESATKTVVIPWLPQYISAAYKLGVAIGSVMAAAMLMIGGMQYLTAGGNSSRVSKAKERIVDSLIGLILVLGTYVILDTMNPNLVNFSSLSVEQIQPITFEKMEFAGKDSEEVDVTTEQNQPEGMTKAQAPESNLDKIFAAYSACTGLDWRILKAVAQAESGLRSNLVNKQGYKGLFQEKTPYCNGGIGPFKKLFDCTDLLDPEVNTAAASTIISRDLKSIQKKCPNAGVDEMFSLMYVAHNNGPAVMQFMLKNGACTMDQQKIYVRKFYEGRQPPCAREDAEKKKCVDAEYGEKKWRYGSKIVNAVKSSGATKPFPPNGQDMSICPSATGKRVFPK
jgi:hypothetical protein